MKKLLIASLIPLFLMGCQKITLEENENKVKFVRFHIVEKQPINRTAIANACTVLDYYRMSDGKTAKHTTQYSEDDTFGTLSDELPYGVHNLYFIGHKNVITDFKDGIASFDKVSDTFSYALAIEVSDETDTSQNIELARNVAKLEVIASDALPENLSTVEFTITGASTKLDIKTGLGLTDITHTKTIQVPESNIGKTNCIFSAYVFLLKNKDTINFTITARDQDGNIIISHPFKDVEMETNYISRLTGRMFGDKFGFEVIASTEWEGVYETIY